MGCCEQEFLKIDHHRSEFLTPDQEQTTMTRTKKLGVLLSLLIGGASGQQVSAAEYCWDSITVGDTSVERLIFNAVPIGERIYTVIGASNGFIGTAQVNEDAVIIFGNEFREGSPRETIHYRFNLITGSLDGFWTAIAIKTNGDIENRYGVVYGSSCDDDI